jgi:hypothetical protein
MLHTPTRTHVSLRDVRAAVLILPVIILVVVIIVLMGGAGI